jgi:hypothetical protein
MLAGALRRVGLLLPLVLVQTAAADEPVWNRVLERRGVVVHQRPAGESNPLESRATTQIDATVLEILAFLQDDARRTEWMARCIEARSLAVHSRWNRLSYTRLAVWPFSDRDVVVQTQITLDPAATSADVRMRNVASELQPPVHDVVRMPSMHGDIRLERVDGRTQIAFTLSIELGGSAPASIARYARQMIPLESVENLREMVPASRSGYAELVRSWRSELRQ